MRALVEEVSATLGAITLLLDAWYMKRYLIVDVLTRDAIVIGQATLRMSRRHRENQDGPASTAIGSPGRSSGRLRKRTRSCRSTAATGPFAIAPPSAGPASSAGVLSEPFGYRFRRWQMDSGTASAVH